MKLKLLFLSLLLAARLYAQDPAGVTIWPLSNPPVAVSSGNVALGGSAVQPGNSTYYFWVVANYLIGNATVSAPFILTGAPSAFSATNYAALAWNPPTGATTYDILMTTSSTPPTGACGCAVATAQAATNYHVTTNSLSAYTVNTLSPATFQITGVNVQQGAGVSELEFVLQNGTVLCGLTSNGLLTCGTSAGLASLQLENNGTPYSTPLVGAASLNYVGCTVSGAAPNLTVTCSGTFNPASPPPIGNVTPNAGTFTTLIGGMGCGAGSGYQPLTGCPTGYGLRVDNTGIVTIYQINSQFSPASTGFINLGVGDPIAWRNYTSGANPDNVLMENQDNRPIWGTDSSNLYNDQPIVLANDVQELNMSAMQYFMGQDSVAELQTSPFIIQTKQNIIGALGDSHTAGYPSTGAGTSPAQSWFTYTVSLLQAQRGNAGVGWVAAEGNCGPGGCTAWNGAGSYDPTPAGCTIIYTTGADFINQFLGQGSNGSGLNDFSSYSPDDTAVLNSTVNDTITLSCQRVGAFVVYTPINPNLGKYTWKVDSNSVSSYQLNEAAVDSHCANNSTATNPGFCTLLINQTQDTAGSALVVGKHTLTLTVAASGTVGAAWLGFDVQDNTGWGVRGHKLGANSECAFMRNANPYLAAELGGNPAQGTGLGINTAWVMYTDNERVSTTCNRTFAQATGTDWPALNTTLLSVTNSAGNNPDIAWFAEPDSTATAILGNPSVGTYAAQMRVMTQGYSPALGYEGDGYQYFNNATVNQTRFLENADGIHLSSAGKNMLGSLVYARLPRVFSNRPVETNAGPVAPSGAVSSPQYVLTYSPNNASGTQYALLAKINAVGATIAVTGDAATGVPLYPCIENCTTTGTAGLAIAGTAPCMFDGAATRGHLVVESATTNGYCSDSGVLVPTAPGSGCTYYVGVVQPTAPTGAGQLGFVDVSKPELICAGAGGGVGYGWVLTLDAGNTTLTGADFSSSSAFGKWHYYVGVGSLTYTMPASAPAANSCAIVENAGSGTATVNPNGLTMDGSGSTFTLAQYQAVEVCSDGSNYHSRGVSSRSGGGLTNPMTTLGDQIYGGVGGTPTRLGIGTVGQVERIVSGIPGWTGQYLPCTVTGSIPNLTYGGWPCDNVEISLTGNVTSSTDTNLQVTNAPYCFNLTQDATGGRSFSCPADWQNCPFIGVAPTTATQICGKYNEAGSQFKIASVLTTDYSLIPQTSAPSGAVAVPSGAARPHFDVTNQIVEYDTPSGNDVTMTIVPKASRTTNQFVINIPNTGTQQTAQPACGDLSGNSTSGSASNTTFCRGDGAWTAISGGSGTYSLTTGYLSETRTAAVAGTTANELVTLNALGTVATSATGAPGVRGIAVTTVLAGNPVEVAMRGTINCVADNNTTTGHYLGVGTTTGGACKDLGSSDPTAIASNLQIIGQALTTVLAGANVSVALIGPGAYGASATGSTNIASITTANYCPDISVTPNTITCSTAGTYTSSNNGDVVWVKVANTTTGATTLNVNSIATVGVTDTSGGAITTNLALGGIYPCRYTSTGPKWQCTGPAGSSSYPTISVLNVQTVSGNGTAAPAIAYKAMPNNSEDITSPYLEWNRMMCADYPSLNAGTLGALTFGCGWIGGLFSGSGVSPTNANPSENTYAGLAVSTASGRASAGAASSLFSFISGRANGMYDIVFMGAGTGSGTLAQSRMAHGFTNIADSSAANFFADAANPVKSDDTNVADSAYIIFTGTNGLSNGDTTHWNFCTVKSHTQTCGAFSVVVATSTIYGLYVYEDAAGAGCGSSTPCWCGEVATWASGAMGAWSSPICNSTNVPALATGMNSFWGVAGNGGTSVQVLFSYDFVKADR